MAIFDWFDYVWYSLFGMSWMFSGNNRFVLGILFLLLIAGFITLKQIKMNITVALLFFIACACFVSSFILTRSEPQYKILNEEKMTKVFQNNKSINISLKSEFTSNSENLIVRNNDGEDVLEFNKIITYSAKSDLFNIHDYPIAKITLSKQGASLEREGRLIVVDKTEKVVEKSEDEKEKTLKIDGVYYGDLTYEVRIGKVTETRTEKFIKIVVDNSKARTAIDEIKELLNE